MPHTLKTTRPIRIVRSIEDVMAIDAMPYDDLVTAHNLYDLVLATAQDFGERKALTVLRSEDPNDVGVSLTHNALTHNAQLDEVTRAANMFRALGIAPNAGVVAFLAPTLPELPTLLLGAQVAGVASTLNCLLSAEAIIDLLNAQKASVLVLASEAADATCWTKAEGVLAKVPTLEHVLVLGDGAEARGGFEVLASKLAKHSLIDAFVARVDSATIAMFRSAPDTNFEDYALVNTTLLSVIFGRVRSVFQRDMPPKMAAEVREQHISMCMSYLKSFSPPSQRA